MGTWINIQHLIVNEQYKAMVHANRYKNNTAFVSGYMRHCGHHERVNNRTGSERH